MFTENTSETVHFLQKIWPKRGLAETFGVLRGALKILSYRRLQQ